MTEETIQSAVRYPTRVTSPTKKGEFLILSSTNWNSYTIGRPRKSDLRELLKCHFFT